MSVQQRLSGKIAIVTGGGRGIGEATSHVLFQHGAKVVVADSNAERGEAVANAIGDMAAFMPLDVRDPEAWDRLVELTVDRFGGVDVLVNNAGIGTGGGIRRETIEDHRNVFDVNVTGVWLGIRSVIPAMIARGGGSIINISSIDGLVGVESLGTYVGSKFAVTGMTRALALELGSQNIRVNSVHPGIIDTPMMGKDNPKVLERMANAIARQPIARKGRPEEIANAVLFFASDESSFCTGASLVVDGGHIAGPYRDPL